MNRVMGSRCHYDDDRWRRYDFHPHPQKMSRAQSLPIIPASKSSASITSHSVVPNEAFNKHVEKAAARVFGDTQIPEEVEQSEEITPEEISIEYTPEQRSLLDRIDQLRAIGRPTELQLAQKLAGFDTNIGGRLRNVALVKEVQTRQRRNIQNSFSGIVDFMQGRSYGVVVHTDAMGNNKYLLLVDRDPLSSEYTLEYYDEDTQSFQKLSEFVYYSLNVSPQDRIILSNRELPEKYSMYHSVESPQGQRVKGRFYHEKKERGSGVYGLHAANAFFGKHAITLEVLADKYTEYLGDSGKDRGVVVPEHSGSVLADVREGNHPRMLFQSMVDYCEGLPEDHDYPFQRLACEELAITSSGRASLPGNLLDEQVDRIIVAIKGRFFTFRKETVGDEVAWFLIDSGVEKQIEVNPIEYLLKKCSGERVSLIYPDFAVEKQANVVVNLHRMDKDPLSHKPVVAKSDKRSYSMEDPGDCGGLLMSFVGHHSVDLLNRTDRAHELAMAIGECDGLIAISPDDIRKELSEGCWGFGSVEKLRWNLVHNTAEFRQIPRHIANFLKVVFVGTRSLQSRSLDDDSLIKEVAWDQEGRQRREVQRTQENLSKMFEVDRRMVLRDYSLLEKHVMALEEQGVDIATFIKSGKKISLLTGRGASVQHFLDLLQIIHIGNKKQLNAFLDGISDTNLSQEIHLFVDRLMAENGGSLKGVRRAFSMDIEGLKAMVAFYKKSGEEVFSELAKFIADIPADKVFSSSDDMLAHFVPGADRKKVSILWSHLGWYSDLITKNNFLFYHAPHAESWGQFVRDNSESMFWADSLVHTDSSLFTREYSDSGVTLDTEALLEILDNYKHLAMTRKVLFEKQIDSTYKIPETEWRASLHNISMTKNPEARYRTRTRAYIRHILAEVRQSSRAKGRLACKLSEMVSSTDEATTTKCDEVRQGVEYLASWSGRPMLDTISIAHDMPVVVQQAMRLIDAAKQPLGNALEVELGEEFREIVAFLRQAVEKHRHYMGVLSFGNSFDFLEMAVAELNAHTMIQVLSEGALHDASIDQLTMLERTVTDAFAVKEGFSDYYFGKQIDMFMVHIRLAQQRKAYHDVKAQLLEQLDFLTRPGASATRQIKGSIGVGNGFTLDLNLELAHAISRANSTAIDIKVERKGGLALSLSGSIPGISKVSGKISGDVLLKRGERFPSLEDFIDEIARRSACMAYSYMTSGLGVMSGVRAKRALSKAQESLQQLERKAQSQHEEFSMMLSEVLGGDGVIAPPKIERGRKVLLDSDGVVIGGSASGKVLGDMFSASLGFQHTQAKTRARKEVDFLTTLRKFPELLDRHPDFIYTTSKDRSDYIVGVHSVQPDGYRKERRRLCLEGHVYLQKFREYFRNEENIVTLEERSSLLKVALSILDKRIIAAKPKPLQLTEDFIIATTGGDHAVAKQMKERQALMLLRRELILQDRSGLTQADAKEFVFKLIKRAERSLQRKKTVCNGLETTLCSMEQDCGIDRKSVLREVRAGQKKPHKSSKPTNEELFIVLNTYLSKNREDFKHLEKIASHVIEGLDCDEEARVLFAEADAEIPSIDFEGVASIDDLEGVCRTEQWREITKDLLRKQVEENFGRWQHYTFVVNQYEVIPYQIAQLNERIVDLKQQQDESVKESPEYYNLKSQIMKMQAVIANLRDKVTVLKNLKRKIEDSFVAHPGRVQMLKKTILDHEHMLRDYRSFCTSDEEYRDFVEEVVMMEGEYIHPNISLSSKQQRSLMIMGSFDGHSTKTKLSTEASLFGAKMTINARQVDVVRDVNVYAEGKYRNFSVAFVVDSNFVESVVQEIVACSSDMGMVIDEGSLSDSIASISGQVREAVGDVLGKGAGLGAEVAVRIEWNFVQSGGKYVLQYVRATKGGEISLKGKASVSGVRGGIAYTDKGSRYISERLGDNTLTYLKMFYNGLRAGYYDRMKSKFESIWSSFVAEHLQEICSACIKMAKEPESTIRQELDADLELVHGIVADSFEGLLRRIALENISLDDLLDSKYDGLRQKLIESLGDLFAARNKVIPTGFTEVVSLPGLRDWVVDSDDIVS